MAHLRNLLRTCVVSCAASLGVAVLGVTSPLRAQVNVEPFRERLTDEGFGGEFSGSITALSGNTEGLVLGFSLLTGVRSQRHFAYLNATGDYSRLNGEVNLQKGFAHARYNYELLSWLTAETFVQSETDKFRRIRLRQLLGLGPRFELVRARDFEWAHGVAYLLEFTRRGNAVDSDQRSVLAHRFANYSALSYTPDPRIQLGLTTYYQPLFSDFSNYRLLWISSAVFHVTELLKSRIDGTMRSEHPVPDPVKPTDMEIKNSLVLSF